MMVLLKCLEINIKINKFRRTKISGMLVYIQMREETYILTLCNIY